MPCYLKQQGNLGYPRPGDTLNSLLTAFNDYEHHQLIFNVLKTFIATK